MVCEPGLTPCARPLVLALQGGMAVGKTSAARWLAAHDPALHICLEDNAAVLAEVRRRGLDKTRLPDYLAIQRLWIGAGCADTARCLRLARVRSSGGARRPRPPGSPPRRPRHHTRCQAGACRRPTPLLPASETRVDFFATNACNLPN